MAISRLAGRALTAAARKSTAKAEQAVSKAQAAKLTAAMNDLLVKPGGLWGDRQAFTLTTLFGDRYEVARRAAGLSKMSFVPAGKHQFRFTGVQRILDAETASPTSWGIQGVYDAVKRKIKFLGDRVVTVR